MKDLCQKWKVRVIFRGVWNSFMAWPEWPDLPYFTTDLRHKNISQAQQSPVAWEDVPFIGTSSRRGVKPN